MTLRRLFAALVLAFLAPGSAFAASYTTQNFAVTAPDDKLARMFGEQAEEYRKQKALEWLGQEMPAWPKRCPLSIRITEAGAGGATSFTFSSNGTRGVVASQEMEIHGPVRQLLNSVLPHEVTHTASDHF